MAQGTLFQVAGVFMLGVLAQWFAWRVRWPSILVLLLTGIVAGPVLGVLDVDEIPGPLLESFIALAVALILFEGAANLRWRDLRVVSRAVVGLVTVGGLLTGLAIALLGHYVLGLEPRMALLLAAILVVTGPTVVLPLLAQLRVAEPTRSVLKWEAIAIDPLGALLAVLVFESLFAVGAEEAARGWFQGAVYAMAGGVFAGLAAAIALIALLKRFWIPDDIQSPFVLAALFAAYVSAEQIFAGGGLVAAIVLGLVLANQTLVPVAHIIEFKESLRVLVLSALFIVLGARLEPSAVFAEGERLALFFVALVLGVRPLAALVSTLGTQLRARERLLLAAVAPRGVVAAAVASVFAFPLAEVGAPGAERIVPIVFATILGTVAFYGLTAPLVARGLGLARARAPGILFGGAQVWVRELAKVLEGAGIPVLLVDTNRHHAAAARARGLLVVEGNILEARPPRESERVELGYLFAVTSNNEANALACQHFRPEFGRGHVFQIAPPKPEGTRVAPIPAALQGRELFGPSLTEEMVARRFAAGERFEIRKLEEPTEFKAGEGAAPPLLAWDPAGRPSPIGERPVKVPAGHRVLLLGAPTPPREAAASGPSAAAPAAAPHSPTAPAPAAAPAPPATPPSTSGG